MKKFHYLILFLILISCESPVSEEAAPLGTVIVNIVGLEDPVDITVTGPENFTLTTSNGMASRANVPAGTYSVAAENIQPYEVSITSNSTTLTNSGDAVTFTITYEFSPRFAAVGDSVILYSTNGADWSANFDTVGRYYYDFCRGDGVWLSIGYATHYSFSNNGIDWVEPKWISSVTGSEVYGCLTYGGKYYVIDSASNVLNSVDGMSWYSENLSIGVLYDIAASTNTLMIIGWDGSNPRCYYNDGTNWINNTAAISDDCSTSLYSISPNHSTAFYIGSSDGSLVYLWDPTDTSGSSSLQVGPGTSGFRINGIAYGELSETSTSNHRLVIAGSGGRVMVNDGSPTTGSWTDVSPSGTGDFRDAAYNDGRFVVVGDSGRIFYSDDGESWTAAASGTTQILNGVVALP